MRLSNMVFCGQSAPYKTRAASGPYAIVSSPDNDERKRVTRSYSVGRSAYRKDERTSLSQRINSTDDKRNNMHPRIPEGPADAARDEKSSDG